MAGEGRLGSIRQERQRERDADMAYDAYSRDEPGYPFQRATRWPQYTQGSLGGKLVGFASTTFFCSSVRGMGLNDTT
jgi:hypothetical protein